MCTEHSESIIESDVDDVLLRHEVARVFEVGSAVEAAAVNPHHDWVKFFSRSLKQKQSSVLIKQHKFQATKDAT